MKPGCAHQVDRSTCSKCNEIEYYATCERCHHIDQALIVHLEHWDYYLRKAESQVQLWKDIHADEINKTWWQKLFS